MTEDWTVWTPKKRADFLESLSTGASVTKSAQAAKVARSTAYNLRNSDEGFKREWDEAIDAGTDLLEDEAARRAKNGTLKPVFHQGVRCGEIREYSDTLMIFLLKGRRPEKFAGRLELTGKDGGAIKHESVGNPDERTVERIVSLLDRARARRDGGDAG